MQEPKYGVLQDGKLKYVPHSYPGAKQIVHITPEYDEETEYIAVSDYIETDTHIEIVMAKYLLELDDPVAEPEQQGEFEESAPWEDPAKASKEELEQKVNRLEQEKAFLELQVQASVDRQDFQEEIITEIIFSLYDQ